MKPPALGLLLGTRIASTYFPPRCGLPRGGLRGPLHPGQIFWACSKIFPSTQTEQNLGHFNLQENDFVLEITQKGVDMRIGLDIASLAERNVVNQIIMISGDSDFVPAAKHARRSGIDFILDPMWGSISPSLSEHIDGRRECVQQEPDNKKDPLHILSQTNEGIEEDEEEI